MIYLDVSVATTVATTAVVAVDKITQSLVSVSCKIIHFLISQKPVDFS